MGLFFVLSRPTTLVRDSSTHQRFRFCFICSSVALRLPQYVETCWSSLPSFILSSCTRQQTTSPCLWPWPICSSEVLWCLPACCALLRLAGTWETCSVKYTAVLILCYASHLFCTYLSSQSIAIMPYVIRFSTGVKSHLPFPSLWFP